MEHKDFGTDVNLHGIRLHGHNDSDCILHKRQNPGNQLFHAQIIHFQSGNSIQIKSNSLSFSIYTMYIKKSQ